ncbi:MAG: toprim domain-containing protein, partial [Geminicoccaceae bacterium]
MPDIKKSAAGREMEILQALGIQPSKDSNQHINCPYPAHGGKNDWRWDRQTKRAYCTCIKGSHSIFDVVMSVKSVDFRESLKVVADILGIEVQQKFPSAKAKALMKPAANVSCSDLASNYLRARLGDLDPVMPTTRTVGWSAFPYFEKSEVTDRPVHVGDWPCVAFETTSADGRLHAHRIYVGPDGAGKADLGKDRDPKKSATKVEPSDNISGCSVVWGDPTKAPICILAEGIETGAAIAYVVRDAITSGSVYVAAAIATSGMVAFIPWPTTREVVVAADRDENKPKKKPGYRAGEKAARAFCMHHHGKLELEIVLPGAEGEGVDFLDMLLADGEHAVRDRLNEGVKFEPGEEDERPEPRKVIIEIEQSKINERVIDYERALGRAGTIFQRGAYLMRVMRVADAASSQGINFSAGSLLMMPAGKHYIRSELCRVATFKRWSARQEDWTVTDPPLSDIDALTESAGNWPNIPVITGITEVPVIADDGRVIDQPGLDEATGIYFDPGATTFPDIPEQPTRDDAMKAIEVIRGVIGGFPFVDGIAESVALSQILTPFKRQFLRAAPIFLNTAPKMGSGKTLLATAVSYIATGNPPASMSQEDNRDEEKKRMLTLLMAGSAVTVIDNIEKPLKSDTLCTVLTEPVWKDRILGKSEEIKVGTATTWIATGNNLQVSGDLSTRALVCTIDPECERPEEREFKINLHEYVPAHRGEIAAACLTIVKAYWLARKQGDGVQGLTTFGRFEQWSAWIREAVVWLGMADPCQARKLVESRDSVREELGALLEAWHEMFDSQGQTSGSVVSMIGDPQTDRERFLRDAILNVASDSRGQINHRRLGKFISGIEGRIEAGLKFVRSGTSQRAVIWSVLPSIDQKSYNGYPLDNGRVSLGSDQVTENDNNMSYIEYSPNPHGKNQIPTIKGDNGTNNIEGIHIGTKYNKGQETNNNSDTHYK